MLEESLEIRQALGEHLGIARSLNTLGTVATHNKEYVLARQHHEASLVIHRELGNRRGISTALTNLGNVANYQGEAATSRRYYDESLEFGRAEGDPFGIYLALINLGRMHFDEKEYHAAGVMWRECLAIVLENAIKGGILWSLLELAGLIAVTDSPLNAARIWGHLERMAEENSVPQPTQFKEEMDSMVASARAALNDDDAAFDAAWQKGRALSVEQAIALAQRETTQPPESP